MTRSEDWGAIADTAINNFEEADLGGETPHAYAYILRAIAHRHGWSDPRVGTYLSKVNSLKNPDGGWGLGVAWDAFGDGTVNPATTTYAITLTDHVGPVFLDLYEQDLVLAADVASIVNLVINTHTTSWTTTGWCIAYSRSGNDNAVDKGCVHNVNTSAASFLYKAWEAGFDAGQLPRIGNMLKQVTYYWNYKTSWWPYSGTTGVSDTNHAGAQADQLATVCYPIARGTALKILTQGLKDKPSATIAHVRLTGMELPPAELAPAWRALGDTYMVDAATFVDSSTTDLRSKAEVARWAARNAEVTA